MNTNIFRAQKCYFIILNEIISNFKKIVFMKDISILSKRKTFELGGDGGIGGGGGET